MNIDFDVRLATENDIEDLLNVNRNAGVRFKSLGFPDPEEEIFLTSEVVCEGIKEDRIWVAELETGEVIGFAFAKKVSDISHLKEIAVLEEYGRQGIGRALIDAVIQWAYKEGAELLTLTTYRDVAWNGPYYTKLGFREIPVEEFKGELRDILEEELQTSISGWERITMAKTVGAV